MVCFVVVARPRLEFWQWMGKEWHTVGKPMRKRYDYDDGDGDWLYVAFFITTQAQSKSKFSKPSPESLVDSRRL